MTDGFEAGGMYPEEYTRELWNKKSGTLAQEIIQNDNPQSVLDVGCGMGFLIEDLLAHGIKADGIEPSIYAVEHALPIIRPRITIAKAESIGQLFDIPEYDVIFCSAIPYIHPKYLSHTLKELLDKTKKTFYMTTYYRGDPVDHMDYQRRIQLTEKEWRELIWDINPSFLQSGKYRYVRIQPNTNK